VSFITNIALIYLIFPCVLLAACETPDPDKIVGRPDTTVDPDVGLDPEPRPDVPRDPSWDDIRDPGWPEPELDPSTDCMSLTDSICSIVMQCGCMPGFVCTFVQDSLTCTIIEDCMALSGTLDVGEECTGYGQCLPGNSCYCTDEGCHCREWCIDSSDCMTAGRECNVEASFAMSAPCTGRGTVPYELCSICFEDEDCDLFSPPSGPTGCPAGQRCAFDTYGSRPGFGCDNRYCTPEGTAGEGDACFVGMSHCQRGLHCHGTSSAGHYCRPYCDATHPCSPGTCDLFRSSSYPDLGVCVP
jgi:hypothetical protein